MIRDKIDSNIEFLSLLSTRYPWIPNNESIRPSVAELRRKIELMASLAASEISLSDFVRGNIFLDTLASWIFVPSSFRYNLPEGAEHYVLWNQYADFAADFDTRLVNETINGFLRGVVGNDEYDFAWYKNPKPSVYEFWHVQVFWTRLSASPMDSNRCL